MNAALTDGKAFRLYLPVANDLPDREALDLCARVRAMGLVSVVPISVETFEDNLRFLQQCVDPQAKRAEPYLEIVIGGDSFSVLHYRGEDIRQELGLLSAQISLGPAQQ